MPRRYAPHFCISLALTLAAAPAAHADQLHGQNFAAPEAAISALATAATTNNTARLLAIYGPAGADLVLSGDKVADASMHAHFAAEYTAHHAILRDGTSRAILVLGADNWPFPIPLVRQAGSWHFDTTAGAQEILNRRIGRNELRAIKICQGFVQAQRSFATAANPPAYAQRIISHPGTHDGLFWPATAGQTPSPLGPQVAAAQAAGYTTAGADSGAEPYHGYLFHLLTTQGPAAPGGARPYIVGGKMTGGFALVGYPAKYGDSGVMTFMVNQNGIVFQKDLGANTTATALSMNSFDPDAGWAAQ